jgi:hypothetical protein
LFAEESPVLGQTVLKEMATWSASTSSRMTMKPMKVIQTTRPNSVVPIVASATQEEDEQGSIHLRRWMG